MKNAPGSDVDSPDTARALMAKQSRKLIRLAGGNISDDIITEVSPLIAYDENDLKDLEQLVKGKTFSESPVLLQ